MCFLYMYPVDYVIVGAGISGLYCALRISKKSPDKTILVIESDTECGGRIRTNYGKGFQVEKGAARFSETHSHLMNLIDEFGLSDEIVPITRKTSFIFQNKRCQYNLDSKIREMVTRGKRLEKKMLQNINVFQLCTKLYDSEEAAKIQALFGYDSEFMRLNSFAAISMFGEDLFENHQYYVMKCGLSELVSRMVEQLSQKKIEIRLGCEVTDVNHRRVVYKKNAEQHRVNAMKVILSTPYLSLRKFGIFKGVPEIHSVKPIPLCRIYAKYPLVNGKPWFHGLEKTTTDNYLRYIIPINPDEGIIMYYSDLYKAHMWRNWSNVSDSILTEMIHKELNSLFPRMKIPKPTQVKCYHWRAGVHLWRPGYDYKKISKQMLKPFSDKDIYVVGECYSTLQDWIEGALKSCDRCLKTIGEYETHQKKRTLRNTRVHK
jgi:glycine/D-amino acid oxidase-like deaminating enzyme